MTGRPRWIFPTVDRWRTIGPERPREDIADAIVVAAEVEVEVQVVVCCFGVLLKKVCKRYC